MTPIEFIDHLEACSLINAKIAGKLREQVEKSSKKVPPKKLARLLVKKKLITRVQMEIVLENIQKHKSPAESSLEILAVESAELTPVESGELGTAESGELTPVESSIDLKPLPEDTPEKAKETKKAPAAVPQTPRKPERDTPIDEDDPLGGSLEEQLETEDLSESALEPATSGSKRKHKRKRYSANRWDSPLMLIGGGALLLMLIVAPGIWFFLNRETADKAFSNAKQDYFDGNYTQAVGKFTNFVDDFPSDDNVNEARIRIVLSKILVETSRKDWESALNIFRSQIPTIEQLENFDLARDELASILPNIMQGFAELARDAKDTETARKNLELAKEAQKEVDNSAYLPTSRRKDVQPKLDEITGIMLSVERRLKIDKELAGAIAAMQAEISKSNTSKAFSIRRQLLKDYPELIKNSDLHQAVLAITEKDREQVAKINELPTPSTEDHPAKSPIKVVIASRSGNEVPGLENNVAFVKAAGAVYALRAATGDVLWRRYIGYESTVQPVKTSREAESDVIVVDSRRGEVARLKSANGEMVWRLPCPGTIFTPTIANGKVFISCGTRESGKLLVANLENGVVEAGAGFPMGLSSSVLVDDETGKIYQAGDHSNLFVLNGADLSCEHVVYLGHGSGSIHVPPIEVLETVLVVENPAPNFALLHVLGADPENDGKLREIMEPPIRLTGNVLVPMIPFGRRVMVTTNRGAVDVFEVDTRNASEPLKRVVSGIVPRSDVAGSYPLFDQNQLWLGDTQLARYELQTSRGELARKWVKNKGDSYSGPMQRIGNVLINIRRRKGKDGITVSANSIANDANDGSSIWETELAVPPGGSVFVNRESKTLNIVSKNGNLFALGRDELQSPVVSQPTVRIVSIDLPVIDTSFELSAGRRAFFGSPAGSSGLIYDPKANPNLKEITFPIGGDMPSATPAIFQDNIVLPTSSGSVYLIDPSTGSAAAHEFQPPISADQSIHWSQPAVVGDTIILSDGARLFKVGVATELQPHLQAVGQSETDLKPFGNTAAIGDTVYVIERGPSNDTVAAINATDLSSSSNKWALKGRVNWGPYAIGEHVFVSSDGYDLVCLDGQQNEKWTIEIAEQDQRLAGPPVFVNGSYILASIRGTVWKVDAATGEEQQKVDLGEPLGSGVIQFNGRSIVLSHDGTLHIFQL